MTTKQTKEPRSVKISTLKKAGHTLSAKGAIEADDKERGSVELEVQPIEVTPVPVNYKSKLTRPQVDLIKRSIAKGASDDELRMFLYVCERTGLDPFTKQIHLVPRWDSKLGAEVRTPIVGIDGLRAVAERTGAYAGNDDPIFDDEEKPMKATVTVYKMVDHQRVPFTATARYEQYVPKKKDGSVASPLWVKMRHLMLGKCAEALALRKAFPAVMSGLYITEEMAQTTGNIAGAPVAPQGDFEKAKHMIGKLGHGLEELKMKLSESTKYSAKEKKELIALVDARIEELAKDAPPADEGPQDGPPDGTL